MFTPKPSQAISEPAMPQHIAHAGGIVNGVDYTNSLDALNESYRLGYRYIEIDLQLTSDNHLVLLHDWDASFTKLFGKTATDKSYVEFMAAESPYKQLDLNGLIRWMETNSEAKIILDTKADSLGMLKTIADRFPELQDRFIPYIYEPSHYPTVKKMGYSSIMLLVGAGVKDSEITKFAAAHKLVGVAMPAAKAETTLPASLAKVDTQSYAWTLNKTNDYEAVKQKGTKGVITDSLIPGCDQLPHYKFEKKMIPTINNGHYIAERIALPFNEYMGIRREVAPIPRDCTNYIITETVAY